MANRWGKSGSSNILFSWAAKSLQMVTETMKWKDTCSSEENYDKPREYMKKQRHYFADKGPHRKSSVFSSSHVWMWEMDHKEGWVLKHWCFWMVMLEKTLENPLDCKEIKPVNPKGNQSWIFIVRSDTEAEATIVWPPDVKSQLKLGKIESRRRRGQQRMRWLDGTTNSMDMSEQTLGYREGQGSLLCCSPWGYKELYRT